MKKLFLASAVLVLSACSNEAEKSANTTDIQAAEMPAKTVSQDEAETVAKVKKMTFKECLDKSDNPSQFAKEVMCSEFKGN